MLAGSPRFHPIALPADRRIARPRLDRLLAQRFEARLTLMVAGPGHGKSTALAEAVANNQLDPSGIDVLLALAPSDTEPTQLLAGLAQSLALEPIPDQQAAIEAIVERVWALAPDPVALIIDDAHQLDDEAAGPVLASLLDRLPTNGHLVLSSRHAPALPVSRLESLDQAIRLGPDDLLFDDDELAALAASRERTNEAIAPLPRLPALADLQLRVGEAAGTDYLWEEILASLGPERLDALSMTAVLDELDDDMVAALCRHRFSASELVVGLPMVESDGDGRFRLHGLLRAALLDRAPEPEVREAGRRAAAVELERGRLSSGARLLAEAGEADEALTVIRRFAALPLLQVSLEVTGAMIALARRLAPSSLLVELLEAQYDFGRYDRAGIDRFVALARHARAEGDRELEALAILRAGQGLERWFESLPTDLSDRLDDLATDSDQARAIAAQVRSIEALRAGDDARAWELLDDFDGFEPSTRPIMSAERICELGWPERVEPATRADSFGQLPQGDETMIGYAMWLRGEVGPELSLAVVGDMIPRTSRSAQRYGRIATLSVGSHIALAAGDTEQARRWADQAIDLAAEPVAMGIRAFALIAEASLAWAVIDGGEDSLAAVDRAMTRLLSSAPFARWPSLAHLLGLPLLYVNHPPSRRALDEGRFGPSLTTAVASGRALVELVEHERAHTAIDLPWSHEALLRAHVPPVHLTRLAAAAAEAGREDAAELLDRLPDNRSHLETLVGWPGRSTSEEPGLAWARERLIALPAPPPSPIRIRALGRLEIDRGSAAPVTDTRRARVRELLAFLVEHRSATRQDIAAALWPDRDDSSAAANLRVNLNHLLNALAPDRSEDSPGHIQSDGGRLVLSDRVRIDVDDFDRLMDDARQLDSDGAAASALPRYRQALDLVAGPYLEEFDAPWAHPTRIRLKAATTEACCRIGELVLAKGEPEEAARWATRALRDAPVDERAGRLAISCYAAMGSRSAALEVADHLRNELDRAGLRPEPATVRLIERIQRRG